MGHTDVCTSSHVKSSLLGSIQSISGPRREAFRTFLIWLRDIFNVFINVSLVLCLEQNTDDACTQARMHMQTDPKLIPRCAYYGEKCSI